MGQGYQPLFNFQPAVRPQVLQVYSEKIIIARLGTSDLNDNRIFIYNRKAIHWQREKNVR